MAVELVTRRWCDPCLRDRQIQVAAQEVTISLDGGRPVSLDVCQACDETLFEALRAVLERGLGSYVALPAKIVDRARVSGEPKQRRKGRPPKDGIWPYTCLVCEERFASDSGLRQHANRVHQLTLAELFGTACPLCGQEYERSRQLGMHVAAEHPGIGPDAGGKRSLGLFFAEAIGLGDVHGVVERQRKAAQERAAALEQAT